MDVSQLRRLTEIPKLFDAAFVEATRGGEDALLNFLCILQTSGLDTPDCRARQGWVLSALKRREEARSLLEATPGILARGYLARVHNHFLQTQEEFAAHLAELQALDRNADECLSDIEGLAHLEFARGQLLVNLRRFDEASIALEAGTQFAHLVKANSLPHALRYQYGRALFMQKNHRACVQLLTQVSAAEDATQELIDTAGETLVWSCWIGGVELPDVAPDWVRVALQVFTRGQVLGPIHTRELQDCVNALDGLRALLNFTVEKFPVHRGPRVLARQQFLLRRLEVPDDPEASHYRDALILILRLLGMAVGLQKEEAEILSQKVLAIRTHGGTLFACLSAFALLQASVWLGKALFDAQTITDLKESWASCNFLQRQHLSQFCTEFCPDVPFVLDSVVHLHSQKPVGVITPERLLVDGVERHGYPLTAAHRYISGKASENDLQTLAEGHRALKGVYRLVFPKLSESIRKAVLTLLLEMESGDLSR